ncbi:WD40-repeat-containing domain protein [Hygrophoropsis aurantiaca]|uniref:WD40-repeat-containing domain protein n=1 Tax=Hygrophoropsis aurantiaca TaxID=72124 RepID=A0ACB8A6L7_9AGAM|nr:WD40-repeat-containing domain protein [Hygrophoropsis aurantiaca]
MRGLDTNWDGCVRTIEVGDEVYSMAFSPTDAIIASASAKHGAQLWNSTTGVNIVTLGPSQPPSTPICFSPSGARVALAFEIGLVTVWDTSTARTIINDKECHRRRVTALKFSPNNTTLASASCDKSIRLWEVEIGKTLHRLQHGDSVLCLAFSVDNKIVISGCQGGLCFTWDVESGQLLRKLSGHTKSVNAIAVSGNGVFIASGSNDKAVRVWDLKTGECVRTYANGLGGGVRYVLFTPDGLRVISVCSTYVHSWTLSSHKSFDVLWSKYEYMLQAASHLPAWVGSVARFVPTRLTGYISDQLLEDESDSDFDIRFSPNSNSIALSIMEIVVYSTSWSLRKKPPSFPALGEPTTLALSSDGSQLGSCSATGTIQLWDPSLALKSWSEYSDRIQERVFDITSSADAKRHIISQTNGEFLVGPRGEVIKKLTGSSFSDIKFLFSEGSCMFAYWSRLTLSLNDDATALRVYKSSTGDRLFRVVVSKIGEVALSPDGTLVSCAHDEGVLEVWDVSSGKSLYQFSHESVSCIHFAPDNSKITCGTQIGEIHLWDLRTGDYLAFIKHGTDRISCLAFSPDRYRIAFGCGDGSLHLCYPLPTGLHHSLIPSSKEFPDPPELVLFSPDGTTINCRTLEGVLYTIKVPSQLFETSDSEPIPSSSPSSALCDICISTANQTPISADNWTDSTIANPHIKFTSDKTNVRDAMFRSGYEMHRDGWVYDGDRRILWLPPFARPYHRSALMAYNDKLTIEPNAARVLFIDLGKCY